MSRQDSATRPVYSKIEIVWPGKEDKLIPQQKSTGEWNLVPPDSAITVQPLVDLDSYGVVVNTPQSVVVCGDRLAALRCLASGISGEVRAAYLDVPRLDVDNTEAVFRGIESRIHSTWLTVLHAHLGAVRRLIRRDGFVIVTCGDLEEPRVRLLMTELFGLENHVATIAWQKAYGPRNMKGMTEFTATHDFVIVFAIDRLSLPYVGLKQAPEGYSNPDGDPRGAWKAEHKGAATRRESTDFTAYIPPYNWKVIDGSFPPGIWRVSPITGVMWGIPQQAGDYTFTVEASDSKQNTSRSTMTISVREGVESASVAPHVPWLFNQFLTQGELSIDTRSLPDAVVGQEYSAILLARGGSPFSGPGRKPGKGRYWEFANYTLLKAYQEDRVKEDRKSLPHPKLYPPPDGKFEVKNQQTWWPGRNKDSTTFAGYSQDATRHLKTLAELGLLKKAVNTAKPEALMARLLNIFSDEGDTVLEVFSDAADFSAVALKTHRRFVYCAGASDREKNMARECAIPRLKAVTGGKDWGHEKLEGEQKLSEQAYLPYAGGGGFHTVNVGEWLLRRQEGQDLLEINAQVYSNYKSLSEAILTSQGYWPTRNQEFSGLKWNGSEAAIILPPEKYLDGILAGELIAMLRISIKKLTVFYFRSAMDFDVNQVDPRIEFRRVPFELAV